MIHSKGKFNAESNGGVKGRCWRLYSVKNLSTSTQTKRRISEKVEASAQE